MLLHFQEVLSRDDVLEMRRLLDAADWSDGRATAGAQGAQVKRNLQLRPDHPVARQIGAYIQQKLAQHAQFQSAVLPRRTLAPLFNRYEVAAEYGWHVDSALMRSGADAELLRSDVSTTLFLSDPQDYDGGELEVQDTYGSHEVKLPAGDAIIYPSTSLHRVRPVTRGARVCAFFWSQSLVAADAQRTLLYELDLTIQRLRARLGDDADTTALTAHYHNLLRQWAAP
ncbi:Fe2+-dependent dioxygenase [Roseateles sp. BYS180W]|uniref:Fe2+-dependent dioxygenase n=1 Tax=Roseateles rivi TaxID=3299028 RepID=A0ABW7FT14_9BURK